MNGARMNKELTDLRNEIDVIDDKIIESLIARFEVTRKIGKAKRLADLNSVDTNRFNLILEKWKNKALDNDIDQKLFELIITSIHQVVLVEHNE